MDEEFAELSLWNPLHHLPDELLIDTQDEDEDDTYLYDEPPATYDVEAKLKEINAALAKQFLPDDPDNRLRRVKFREDLVEAQIPPESHCSASSEEEEEEEDDGYGDSTEVSDDMEDTTSSANTQVERKEEQTESLASELAKVVALKEERVSNGDEEISECPVQGDHREVEDPHPHQVPEEPTNEKAGSQEIEDDLDGTRQQEENTSSEVATCVNRSDEGRLLESRARNSPLRIETPKTDDHLQEAEETMVMASEGRFHIVNITDMSSTSSAGHLERPKTAATLERTHPLNGSDQISKRNRTQSSSLLQKLKRTYVAGHLDKGSSSTSSGSRHRQTMDTVRGPDVAHETLVTKPSRRVGYGLTVEQKEERERKLRELMEKKKLKEEQELEEKRERKERGESAFREWLNQKKKVTHKTSSDETQVTNKEDPVGGSEAFRKWLQRKKDEREEERKLEELRLRQEEELFCRKTREDNERAFKQWLRRKSKSSSGQMKLTFKSSVRRAKLNTLKDTVN